MFTEVSDFHICQQGNLKGMVRGSKLYRLVLGPDDPGAGAGNTGDPNTLTVVATVDPKTKRTTYKMSDGTPLFTQDHMNFEIGQVRVKEGEKNKSLVAQLQELADKSTTSEAVRAELENRIEDIKKAQLTEKQQADLEIKRLTRELEKTSKGLTSERDSWQQRYTQSHITNEIHAAVQTQGGLPAFMEQFEAWLSPKTSLKPVLDANGKPTDKLEAVVDFNDMDKDGNPVTLALSVPKAVERMKQLPQRFGNLFAADQKSGVGGTNAANTGQTGAPPDFSKMSLEQYNKWRVDNKHLFQP
jgi:hypothetical protein